MLVADGDDEGEEDDGGVGEDWESRQLAYAEAYSRHAAGTSLLTTVGRRSLGDSYHF